MHISPCGWYCFTPPVAEEWDCDDTPEMTLLTHNDRRTYIELLSARKSTLADAEEISQMHEDYLVEKKILPQKTVVSENPFRVRFYVTRGGGMDEKDWIVAHAFWHNYCVFLQFHGDPEGKSSPKVQAFYDILNSLQPLTRDV